MTRTALLLAACVVASADIAGAAEPKFALPAGAGHRGVELPTTPGGGPAREMKVLLDTPSVKIAAITLRAGTVLEEHSAPVPVTIQALTGSGTVRIGEASEAISPGRMLFLAPGVPHAVVPEKGTDLVLLVHHLKGAAN